MMVSCGGYIGLVPHETRADDTIGILLGCGAPVVLRAASCSIHGLQYELIGEAYVHGWMEGEMAGETPNDGHYQHIGCEDILLL